jgi:hypothetical protein
VAKGNHTISYVSVTYEQSEVELNSLIDFQTLIFGAHISG